jgi:hypothetical protein
MDNYVQLSDTVASSEGKAYVTMDGANRELFETQSLRAQLELIVQARRMLGNKMTQHKVVGATGTGSATLYFMNSQQLNHAIAFLKNGVRSPIKLQVVNEDAQSTTGRQEVVMTNVIFNNIPVAAVEESDDPITFDSDFTYDGIENLESFVLPENYR